MNRSGRDVYKSLTRKHKNDMAFGFKRIDHIAFALFPRTYGEIMRGRKIMSQQAETIGLFGFRLNQFKNLYKCNLQHGDIDCAYCNIVAIMEGTK